VSRLLKPYVQPSDVVRYIRETWGISDRCAYDLLRDARAYLAARWGMSKEYLRCELADFLSTLTGDQAASASEKIAAVNAIAKMLGLFAPDKAVVAQVGGAAEPEAARDLLQHLHREALASDAAAEAASAFYEAVSGAPKAPLADRVRRWHEQGDALRAEMDAADAEAGRAVNGLREVPPELPNGQ
jgi:hypothetical protein